MSSAPTSSSSRLPLAALTLLCLAATLWLGYVEYTRWLAAKWYLADVGNIHYALVNTLRGRFMFSPLTENNHFAWHFTPTLLLLAPFTLLSSYPIPLVGSYVVAGALAPLPLWHLGRRAGLGPWSSLAPGVLFLGNVFVGSVQLADHFEILYVFLFLSAMAAAPSRPGIFWPLILLTLGVKEDAAVWVLLWAGVSWVGAWRTGDAFLGRRFARLAGVCLLWAGLAAGGMALCARGSEGNALAYVERAGGMRLGWDNVRMLGTVMASCAFLPLFAGPTTLLVFAPAPLLLSEFPFTRQLLYYYSYPFLPFLFLATVEAMGRFDRWARQRHPQRSRLRPIVPVLAAVAGIVQFPMPTRSDGYRRLPLPVEARDEYRLRLLQEKLPHTAPAAIQFGLWGVTPTRPDARKLSYDNITSETWVVLDLNTPHGGDREAFIQLARGILDEAQSGTRPLLHTRNDLFLVGPVEPRVSP